MRLRHQRRWINLLIWTGLAIVGIAAWLRLRPAAPPVEAEPELTAWSAEI